MSALTEQIRDALYTKLNVSGVTDLATDGVWFGESESLNDYKTLIFEDVSNIYDYAFGFTETHQDSIWHLKAFVDKDSDNSKSPIRLGEQIITAAKTAIGQTLALSTGTCLGVMVTNDLPKLKQPFSDRTVWMVGCQLRIWADSNESTTPTPNEPSYSRVRIIDEVPSGAINGSNVTFTTAYNFVPSSVEITLNGIAQRSGSGNDFITTGENTIIFTTSLEVGDVILVDYERV